MIKPGTFCFGFCFCTGLLLHLFIDIIRHKTHLYNTLFQQEPIALFEIFRKADRKTFISDSISFPIDSDEIPESIVKQLEDTESNRIDYR